MLREHKKKQNEMQESFHLSLKKKEAEKLVLQKRIEEDEKLRCVTLVTFVLVIGNWGSCFFCAHVAIAFLMNRSIRRFVMIFSKIP